MFEAEEDDMTRAHIGCGSVYLRDYVNIDIPSPRTFLASERPDLVERYITTEDDYYGRHKRRDEEHSKLAFDEYVCDRYGDFEHIPITGPVTEILMRQCWEHQDLRSARTALDLYHKIMPVGGILRIDVPDHEGTLRKLVETGDEFYIRHLLGPRDSEYGYHVLSYTRDGLRTLVESSGFKYVIEEPNIHYYPAFCLRFENV